MSDEVEAQVEAEPQVPATVISDGHPAGVREPQKEEEPSGFPEEEAVADIPVAVEHAPESPAEKEAEPELPAYVDELKLAEDKGLHAA